MTGLLDTNVALYLLGGRLAVPLPEGEYGVSVVTEMEMLAWPSLTPEEEEEEARVRAFLGTVELCELSAPIRARAVRATPCAQRQARRDARRDRVGSEGEPGTFTSDRADPPCGILSSRG